MTSVQSGHQTKFACYTIKHKNDKEYIIIDRPLHFYGKIAVDPCFNLLEKRQAKLTSAYSSLAKDAFQTLTVCPFTGVITAFPWLIHYKLFSTVKNYYFPPLYVVRNHNDIPFDY